MHAFTRIVVATKRGVQRLDELSDEKELIKRAEVSAAGAVDGKPANDALGRATAARARRATTCATRCMETCVYYANVERMVKLLQQSPKISAREVTTEITL